MAGNYSPDISVVQTEGSMRRAAAKKSGSSALSVKKIKSDLTFLNLLKCRQGFAESASTIPSPYRAGLSDLVFCDGYNSALADYGRKLLAISIREHMYNLGLENMYIKEVILSNVDRDQDRNHFEQRVVLTNVMEKVIGHAFTATENNKKYLELYSTSLDQELMLVESQVDFDSKYAELHGEREDCEKSSRGHYTNKMRMKMKRVTLLCEMMSSFLMCIGVDFRGDEKLSADLLFTNEVPDIVHDFGLLQSNQGFDQ